MPVVAATTHFAHLFGGRGPARWSSEVMCVWGPDAEVSMCRALSGGHAGARACGCVSSPGHETGGCAEQGGTWHNAAHSLLKPPMPRSILWMQVFTALPLVDATQGSHPSSLLLPCLLLSGADAVGIGTVPGSIIQHNERAIFPSKKYVPFLQGTSTRWQLASCGTDCV
jgi:hypothetical protein